MQIHVAQNGQQTGPFDEAQVREKLASGEFAPTDLAWHADLAGWQPLNTVLPDVTPASPVAAVPVVFPGAPAAPAYVNPPAAAAMAPPAGGYAPLPVAGAPGQMVPPQFYNPAGQVDPNLADLGQRFIGALVDTGIAIVFAIPGLIMLFARIFSAAQSSPSDPDAIRGAAGGLSVVVLILGSLVLMGIQGYLLVTSGQSIGKKVARTRVVLVNGQRAGLVPVFLLRTLLPGVVFGYFPQIPIIGAIFSCVGSIYGITDICFVFRNDRRCLHDLIAGTKVVRA